MNNVVSISPGGYEPPEERKASDITKTVRIIICCGLV